MRLKNTRHIKHTYFMWVCFRTYAHTINTTVFEFERNKLSIL